MRACSFGRKENDVAGPATVETQTLLEPALARCWGDADLAKLHQFLQWHRGDRDGS